MICDHSISWVSSIPVEHWLNSSNCFYLIRRITNQNILGTVDFYFNFKLKWKQVWKLWTWIKSLRSSITAHCWLSKKRNAIVIRRSTLSTEYYTCTLLGRIFIKIHYKTLKYFKLIQNKSSSVSKRNVQTNVNSAFSLRLNSTIKYAIDFKVNKIISLSGIRLK